jgi:hypothetical protein
VNLRGFLRKEIPALSTADRGLAVESWRSGPFFVRLMMLVLLFTFLFLVDSEAHNPERMYKLISRLTVITRDARSIGLALREDDVVDGLFEWTLLIAGAELDFNYWIESNYDDLDDARLVAYLLTPVVDQRPASS